MSMPSYEERVKFIVNIIFVTLIVAIVFVFLRLVIPVMLPFLLGFAIAFVLKPATRYLTEHTPFRRKAISLVVIALFYLALTSILCATAALLVTQMGSFMRRLPEFYSQGLEPVISGVNTFIFDFFSRLNPSSAGSLGTYFETVKNTMNDAVASISTSAVNWIANGIKGLPMLLTTLIFTVISSILISVNYQSVASFLLRQLPPKYRNMLLDAKNFMIGSLFNLLKAYVIILAITMVELTVGLWILGVELPLAIGVIIALLDILPLIGTGGILIPWSVIEFFRGNFFLSAGLLILFAIVAIVRNLIEPKIVGNQIGLHPVVTIAAMYAGLRLFGFGGLIMAPLCVILLKYLNDGGKICLFK